MALWSTQLLTEMSTRNLPGGKRGPGRKADNVTAICEPTVWIMWEPRRLTILWASTACYRDSFNFILLEVGWHLHHTMSENNAHVVWICAVYFRVRESGVKQQNNTAGLITRARENFASPGCISSGTDFRSGAVLAPLRYHGVRMSRDADETNINAT
jgi:hypothetical protein